MNLIEFDVDLRTLLPSALLIVIVTMALVHRKRPRGAIPVFATLWLLSPAVASVESRGLLDAAFQRAQIRYRGETWIAHRVRGYTTTHSTLSQIGLFQRLFSASLAGGALLLLRRSLMHLLVSSDYRFFEYRARCPTCDYSLVCGSNRCPECGAEVAIDCLPAR